MRGNEKLARRLLLWGSDGNPRLMHELLSRKAPHRGYLIRLFARIARRPEIAGKLPSEAVIPFFEESADYDARKEAEKRKTEAWLGLGALLLGKQEQENADVDE
jgi:hypothetical protein